MEARDPDPELGRLDFAPAKPTDAGDAPLLSIVPEEERLCRSSSIERGGGIRSFMASCGVHAAAIAVAITVLTGAQDGALRGGEQAIEVILVGSVEQAAATAGEAAPPEAEPLQEVEDQPPEEEAVAAPEPAPTPPVQEAIVVAAPQYAKKKPANQQRPGDSSAERVASAKGGTQGASQTAGTAQIASYKALVSAHLERYKRYPEWASRRGLEGRNNLTFTIARSGAVLGVALIGSSGIPILDEATLAAVRRAEPFPPIPEGGPATMTFTTVLRYGLR